MRLASIRYDSPMAKYHFTVEVQPQYLPDQSDAEDDSFVFAYTITITNTGDVTAQLIAKNLSFAPELTIRPGYRFNVVVVKDLVLPKPYQAFDYAGKETP